MSTQTQRTHHPLIVRLFLEINTEYKTKVNPATSPRLVNEFYSQMETRGIIKSYDDLHGEKQ